MFVGRKRLHIFLSDIVVSREMHAEANLEPLKLCSSSESIFAALIGATPLITSREIVPQLWLRNMSSFQVSFNNVKPTTAVSPADIRARNTYKQRLSVDLISEAAVHFESALVLWRVAWRADGWQCSVVVQASLLGDDGLGLASRQHLKTLKAQLHYDGRDKVDWTGSPTPACVSVTNKRQHLRTYPIAPWHAPGACCGDQSFR